MTSVQRDAGRSRDELVEERRAAILAAAEELIAVYGFDALRLRDVSQKAGVSIGLIQHYFITRDDLLQDTMRAASVRRAEQWSQLASDQVGPSERLAVLLEGSLNDRHRCVVWLETCAAATRHPVLRPDVERTQEAWRAALRAAIEDGVATKDFAPTIPAEDIVVLLVSLIDGLMLATATESDDSSSHDYRIQLLREASQRLLHPAPTTAG